MPRSDEDPYQSGPVEELAQDSVQPLPSTVDALLPKPIVDNLSNYFGPLKLLLGQPHASGDVERDIRPPSSVKVGCVDSFDNGYTKAIAN